MNFNQKLHTLRKQKGITQQELADALSFLCLFSL